MSHHCGHDSPDRTTPQTTSGGCFRASVRVATWPGATKQPTTAARLTSPINNPTTVRLHPRSPILRLLAIVVMTPPRSEKGSAGGRGAAGVRGEAPGVPVGVGELADAITPEHVLWRHFAAGPGGSGAGVLGVHVLAVQVEGDRATGAATDGRLAWALVALGAEHNDHVLPGHLGVHDLAVRTGVDLALL